MRDPWECAAWGLKLLSGGLLMVAVALAVTGYGQEESQASAFAALWGATFFRLLYVSMAEA